MTRVKCIMKRALLGAAMALIATTGMLNAQGAKESGALVLLSYNIRNGRGMDNKTDYQRTAKVITDAGPDVVALQEVDNKTTRSKKQDVLGILAKETGMIPTYAKAINYDGGEYGVGLLSKEKPMLIMRARLPGREERRVLLIVEFNNYCVFVTHLSLNTEDRLAALNIIARKAAAFSKPVFLMGDLNFSPESEEMKRLEQDFRVLSDVKKPTFPAPNPTECIDYIAFYKKGKKKVPQARGFEVIDEPMASDHRPLKITVTVSKAKESTRKGSQIVVPGCK